MFMCHLLIPIQGGGRAAYIVGTAKTARQGQPEYHTRGTDTRKEGSVQRGKSQDARSQVTTQLDQDDLARNERHTQDHGCARTAIVVAVVGVVRVFSQFSQRLPPVVPPDWNEEVRVVRIGVGRRTARACDAEVRAGRGACADKRSQGVYQSPGGGMTRLADL